MELAGHFAESIYKGQFTNGSHQIQFPWGSALPMGSWEKAYGQKQAGLSLQELYHHHSDQEDKAKLSWLPRQLRPW